MRLFIAAEIPAEVREALARLIDELRRELPGPRWVRAEGIHLTFRFLGEIPEADLGPLREAMTGHLPGAVAPFPVTVEGLGVFPEKGRPRVLWAGLTGPAGALERIQSVVETALRSASLRGVKPETRPFHPHLTLARLGGGRPPSGLAASLERRAGRVWGRLEVTGVALFQSLLKPAGAEYRMLERWSL